MASATTVKERIELQTMLFRTSATWAVSESSRFTYASPDLTESASAPLKARVVAAAMIAPKARHQTGWRGQPTSPATTGFCAAMNACASGSVSKTCGASARSDRLAPSFSRMKALVV